MSDNVVLWVNNQYIPYSNVDFVEIAEGGGTDLIIFHMLSGRNTSISLDADGVSDAIEWLDTQVPYSIE